MVLSWDLSFFLVYINDLVDNLTSKAKLFADDTFLHSVVYDERVTAERLDKGFETISNWAHQLKMHFNLIPIKISKQFKLIVGGNWYDPLHG